MLRVDGQNLNYDTTNYARTTDFTGLCDAMARQRGKTTGKYSSVSIHSATSKWVQVVQKTIGVAAVKTTPN